MTKRSHQAARSSGTVLVVDPDQSERSTARRVLESCGYRVLDAADAAAAEQIARLYVGPIHAPLIEVDLSGASGWALADRLRTLRPEPRVLFVSRHARADLGAEGRIVADLPLMQKPFKAPELEAALRRLLGPAER